MDELEQYEMAARQKKKTTDGKKADHDKNVKGSKKYLTMAGCQRLGYDYETIAEADKNSGIGSNLFNYLQKHPKLREAYDRGRLLRALVKTAPNSLIYEAATKLKNLGFNQFNSGQDLRDFLDKDPEANELWETTRVNAAIENRENLRNAAGQGNVKAIELLDKWHTDRQKETGETSVSFNRVGVNQMAELFDVTRITIYQWKTEKGLPVNIDGTFDLHAAIRWFEDFTLKKSVRGREAVTAINPLQQVKTERQKLMLEQERGEMVERGAVIGFQAAMMQNLVNAFNAITDLANRVFGQSREEIVARLEEFRDDVTAKLQHVPAELKLTDEAIKKLAELFEIIKPQNMEDSPR